jgi:hypothetical protein
VDFGSPQESALGLLLRALCARRLSCRLWYCEGSERAADAGAFCFEMVVDVINGGAREGETVKKNTKLRPWTKEDIRTLKTLARENTKTTVIARD